MLGLLVHTHLLTLAHTHTHKTAKYMKELARQHHKDTHTRSVAKGTRTHSSG